MCHLVSFKASASLFREFFEMSSLQQRIESYTTLSTNLIVQLSELSKLRDRLREAQSNGMSLQTRVGQPSKRERRRARRGAKEDEMINHIYERKMPAAAQREARKAFKQADTKVAMSEHERTQEAFHANRVRLKAERLAREAVSSDEPKQKLKI
jgi:hypothetical protein